MACVLGIEQDCNECRMCGNGKGGKKMTKFERIKGMSVEELAGFIHEITDNCSSEMACNQFCHDDSCPGHCEFESCKEWLESECDAEC